MDAVVGPFERNYGIFQESNFIVWHPRCAFIVQKECLAERHVSTRVLGHRLRQKTQYRLKVCSVLHECRAFHSTATRCKSHGGTAATLSRAPSLVGEPARLPSDPPLGRLIRWGNLGQLFYRQLHPKRCLPSRRPPPFTAQRLDMIWGDFHRRRPDAEARNCAHAVPVRRGLVSFAWENDWERGK